MGNKLLWVGLTFIQTATILDWNANVRLAGAIIMVLGCILMVMDK